MKLQYNLLKLRVQYVDFICIFFASIYYINLLIKVLFIYLLLTFTQPIYPYIIIIRIQNKFCSINYAFCGF